MQEKLFSAISLCRKAGKLLCGMDTVCEAIRGGRTWCVMLTADVAARSERQVRLACEQCDEGEAAVVHKLPYTMEELAPVAGKPYGIFAVCDKGFADLIGKQMTMQQPASPISIE